MSVSTGVGVNALMIAPPEAVLFDMDGVMAGRLHRNDNRDQQTLAGVANILKEPGP